MSTMTTQSPRFMFLLRGGVSKTDLSPDEFQRQTDRYMSWIEKLRAEGRLEGGEPLAEIGKVLSGKDGRLITDGPFTELKEEVGGYFIVRATDLEAAVEIAKGCPVFRYGGTVEVRPIERVPGL
jgi:hypothetical protein